ncbi:MAG: hypothetical protein R3B89_04400 [Polyangiaceae bacterium]
MARGLLGGCVVALLGAACSGAPARPPLASVAVPAPVEGDGADSAPMDRPYRVAPTCRVSEPKLDRSVTLRLSLGGASVATVQDGETSLLLGREPLMLEIEGGGVSLRTPFDRAETPLRLREAIALHGVLTPKPEAEVRWVAALPNTAQRVRYESELIPGVEVVDQVPCASLALRTADYEVPGSESETQVVLDGTISVRESVAEAPGVVFEAKSPVQAVELERKAGFVRILVDTEFEVLRGWVPERVVSPSPGLVGRIGYGFGAGGLGLRGASHIYYTRCDHELTLFARVGHEQGEVGVIHPETRFEVESSEPGAHPGFTAIDLWQGRIMPAEGAIFMVYSDALESGCGHPR